MPRVPPAEAPSLLTQVVTERAVAVGGVEVFVESVGEGDPLLFVHGSGLDRRMWDGEFFGLASRFQVIRYDLPGYGRSPVPDAAFSQSEVLLGVCDALGVAEVNVVGLSYGASVAVDFVLEYPDRAHSLVVAAPGVSGYPWSSELLRSLASMVQRGQAEGTQALAEAWLEDPHMVPAMEQARLRPRLRHWVEDNAERFLRPAPATLPHPSAWQRLDSLTLPVLVIVGDRDVPDVQHIADGVWQNVPGAQKVVLRQVGHLPNLEAPEEFRAALQEFWSRVP